MLYPTIAPYAQGLLNVGQGHQIYWEQCGNPQGQPVLYLHGGPGGGCSERARQYFNPQHYRVVLFDQRACGRSTPHASTRSGTQDHSLAHLVADIERLRQHLAIERWLLCGVSWGCTLGLAYTRAHRERVSALLLRSVFTAQKSELDWLYRTGGASELMPHAWREFAHAVGADPGAGHADLLAAYADRLQNGTTEQQAHAALAWCLWEQALGSVHEDRSPLDPHQSLAQARIATHLFTQDAQLKRPDFLWPPSYLGGIPGLIVQGQKDMVSPSVTAQQLAQQWLACELCLVAEAGHVSSDLPLRKAFMSALEEMELLCL